jgi:hypothetical protein
MSHEMLVVSNYIIWVILIVLLLAVFALYRHFGQLYVNSAQAKENQGPRLGSSLRSIGGIDMSGRVFELPTVRPTLLLLADTQCEVCASVRDGLAVLRPVQQLAEMFVLCSGPPQDVLAWQHRVPDFVRVVHDAKGGMADKLAVNGTPFAVGVSGDGIVRWKGIVSTADAVKLAVDELLVVEPPTGEVLPLLATIKDGSSDNGKVILRWTGSPHG